MVPSPAIATEVRALEVGESDCCHVAPASLLLMIIPSSPTATPREPRSAMSLMDAPGPGPT